MPICFQYGSSGEKVMASLCNTPTLRALDEQEDGTF